ncbi:MAG: hypothetical protein H6753_00735 [Candidatus Omnitrophica bacterium]|nr:hypothetical protein [Candidatus Omnitrophota bacterium]
MRHRIVIVNDHMQKNYHYQLVQPMGKNFDQAFKPELSPQQMLSLGVFGGKYMTDCVKEFPSTWFKKAKLCPLRHDSKSNFFGVKASQSLHTWRMKGWIHPADPRGWFQWYCRYYMGRRIPDEDVRQIKRWRAMQRHVTQIKRNCKPRDLACRRKQRQALLHWAYDSRKF